MRSVASTKDISFFTPRQNVIGSSIKHSTAKKNDTEVGGIPKLFTPLKIRSMEIPNRIGLSPMCMYSSSNAMPTIFHLVHYGTFALRGAGIIILESTAIDSNSLTTPNDLGLWNETMAKEHYNKIVEFVHSQNGKIGIQLNSIDFMENLNKTITDSNFSTTQLKEIINNFGIASNFAINTAKYDFIEIKATNENIIDKLRSPLWNKRSAGDPYSIHDEYNGNRFLFEIVKKIRENIPVETPLFFRLHDCDKSDSPNALTQRDTINLCKKLVPLGIDVFDFAIVDKSDFNSKNYLTKQEFFHNIRKHIPSKVVLTSSSSKVQNAMHAEQLIQSNQEDFILCGRLFLNNPNLVSTFAEELNIEISKPVQYSWGFYPTEQYLEKE